MKACVSCLEKVSFLPFYNKGKNTQYIADIPFCTNPKCPRWGILTVITTDIDFSKQPVKHNKQDAHIKKSKP